MTTTHEQCDTSMSDEAYDLINCFYDGVDVLVRDLAEQIAVDEKSFLSDDPNVVAIEVRHVREAGRKVIQALRSLLKDGEISPRMEDAISTMGNCFDVKD